MAVMSFLTVSLLFALGLFTVLSQRNVFKTVIGLTLMESAVLLLLISRAYIPGGSALFCRCRKRGWTRFRIRLPGGDRHRRVRYRWPLPLS